MLLRCLKLLLSIGVKSNKKSRKTEICAAALWALSRIRSISGKAERQ